MCRQQFYNMHSQKLLTSISTIPNQSKLTYPPTHQPPSSLTLPTSLTLPLKFPKKYIRKQTNQTMLTQTYQHPQKSCVRVYGHANKSRIFQQPNPQARRKLAKDGIFQSLARESVQVLAVNRSVEDFGAVNNRKKFVEGRHIRPDPIVIGHSYNQHNSALQKVWGQARRHRDNGKQCEQTLNWKPTKTKGYLQRYKQKTNGYQSSKYIANKFSIL